MYIDFFKKYMSKQIESFVFVCLSATNAINLIFLYRKRANAVLKISNPPNKGNEISC